MESSIFDQLDQEKKRQQSINIIDLFHRDPLRATNFSFTLEDIYIDFSKNIIDEKTVDILIDWLKSADFEGKRAALFAGEKINKTEGRAVMHMALRAQVDDNYQVDGVNVVNEVLTVRQKCADFADKVRSKKWLGTTGKPIDTIVNIGIGGSDLGPKLVVNALTDYTDPSLTFHFISRLDTVHINRVLKECDAETTLFIVASKTFTTLETIHNAQFARSWSVAQLGKDSVSKHFVAVSTNLAAVTAFGIDPQNMFPFWDWVGGRYSVWSSVGLIAMIALGKTAFDQFLSGARAVDQHFINTPLKQNIPVLMGAIGAWYRTIWEMPAQAILSYDENLALFVSYLQQLDMESNGKSIDELGTKITEFTGLIIFGGLGNDGQHAYYQWLHQGTQKVACDFFAPVFSEGSHEDHALLLANCLAQSQALMIGKSREAVITELTAQGLDDRAIDQLVPFKVFEGNRPSTTFLYPTLTPNILGMLLALYEHKIFVQGALWNINAFDQWGVELGKALAKQLIPALVSKEETVFDDPSTEALVHYIHSVKTIKKPQ